MGLRKKGSKLYLSIHNQKPEQDIWVEYENKKLVLPHQKWVNLELPLEVLGKEISLFPMDSQPLNNVITLSGFTPSPLLFETNFELTDLSAKLI